jgi:sugar phosphate isomerase/epimerase
MLVLSCTTRSFPGTPLDRALMRITWAGFEAVELYAPPGASLPDPVATATLLEAAGTTPTAIDAGALGGEDAGAALESAAHVGRCAVLAHDLQCNRIVCDLALPTGELAAQTVRQLLAALSEMPVLVCLRNRPEDGPEAVQRLLELIAAHPDRLGLALNPGAALQAGWDPLQGWPLLGPVVRHVYATDADEERPAALGTGDARWEELAGRLLESGYSGAVTLWQEEGRVHSDPIFAEAEVKEARFLMEGWFHRAG